MPQFSTSPTDDRTPAPAGRDDAAEIAKLVEDVKRAADELILENYDRGDVKLLAKSFQELQECVRFLQEYRGRRKVTVFGSARTKRDHPSYIQAKAFGELMAARGYYVITGAGPGIMEAAHEGAGRAHSIGFNIRLPFEQGANPIVDGDGKLRTLNYFFTRKLMFLKDTDGIVLFPGGFGTMDEGFEVLTLMQTGRAKTMPLVLVEAPGSKFWSDWQGYIERELLGDGLISPEDMALFKVVHHERDAADEIANFYRVYDSQRYVEGRLVLRLKSEIPDAAFAEIKTRFADLLAPSGGFERTVAHRHEHNEPHLRSLPRLKVGFNRRSFGRLRSLIDWINENVPAPNS